MVLYRGPLIRPLPSNTITHPSQVEKLPAKLAFSFAGSQFSA